MQQAVICFHCGSITRSSAFHYQFALGWRSLWRNIAVAVGGAFVVFSIVIVVFAVLVFRIQPRSFERTVNWLSENHICFTVFRLCLINSNNDSVKNVYNSRSISCCFSMMIHLIFCCADFPTKTKQNLRRTNELPPMNRLFQTHLYLKAIFRL